MGLGPITHIVIIVQENRTFDNLFNGFPGADTVRQGLRHNGKTQPLAPIPLDGPGDICHSVRCFLIAYDSGKLDGFSLLRGDKHMTPLMSYSYVQQQDAQTYWSMATQYTLADNMFQSNGGPSFAAHQYLIAGQTGFDNDPPHRGPWGCDTFKGPPPCFDYQTLADLADAQGVSWRYYASGVDFKTTKKYGHWLAYDAISHIRYGPDWTTEHVSIPQTNVLSDITSGNLAQISWVTPTFPSSDHHGCAASCLGGGQNGPAWVASIVNAIGTSPYWNSTAILVTWDDWGGWYDHVLPPFAGGTSLGFRVPLLVISPYAKQGYVSHVPHEFGSILHFAETTYGLGSLGTRDASSDDLSDSFDFGQAPIPFQPFSHAPLRPVPEMDPDDDDEGNNG